MTLPAQVKVFASNVASFGGVPLRRLGVALARGNCALLVHEAGHGTAYVLEAPAPQASSAPLHLKAEWGEPLGQVQHFETGSEGEVTAFGLLLRLRSGDVTPVTVGAADAYWSGGELFCRRRCAYALRDVQKGRRPRVRTQAA